MIQMTKTDSRRNTKPKLPITNKDIELIIQYFLQRRH